MYFHINIEIHTIIMSTMSEITTFAQGISTTKKFEYDQLNPYIDYRSETWNRYTEEYDSNPPIQDLLDVVMPILNEGKGESTEDGDYGMIPDYYTWVHIGKWDKPYICKN